jgi:hypothetical protein
MRPVPQSTLEQIIDGRNRAVRAGDLEAVAAFDLAMALALIDESENTVAAGLPERRNQ